MLSGFSSTLSDQAIHQDGPVSYVVVVMRGWVFFLTLTLQPLNRLLVKHLVCPLREGHTSFSSNCFRVCFLLCLSRAQKKLSCSLEDLRSEPVDKVSPSVSP